MSPSRPARRAITRAILGVAAACLSVQLVAQATQSVFVGVLRADGLLVPTAIHDGTAWWNRWPFSYESDESIQRLALPSSVNRIPADWLPPGVRLPEEWRVQMNTGGNISIRLRSPARPKGFSLAALIGLSTSYRVAPSVDLSTVVDSELGVAVAGDATLGRFSSVSDQETKVLLAALANDLERAESEEIARRIQERVSQPDWNGRPVVFPADEQKRKLIAMSSYSAVRADRKEQGRTFFYFKGQKDYGARPWPNCDATMDFDAIVVRDATGAVSTRSLGAYTTLECSRDNAINGSFQPLASLHWHGPTLWVIRVDAEDGFDYLLIDPSAVDPAAAVPLKGLWQMRPR